MRILVAFSGEVEIKDPDAPDVGETYREAQMNTVDGRPVPESRLPCGSATAQRRGSVVVATDRWRGLRVDPSR